MITEQFLESINDGTLTIDGHSMEGIIDNAREWMFEGWGLPTESDMANSPPVIAAALFNEAKTQDGCVERGESNIDFPRLLRALAFAILEADGHKPIIPAYDFPLKPY